MAVFACVSPSGLVMAAYAPAGAIAGAGLATLAIGTAGSMIMAIRHARPRRFRMHRIRATRCFMLLGSPLLLRLNKGFVIVLRLDPDLNDTLNPWISWLIPLVSYEIWWRFAKNPDSKQWPISKKEAMS